MVVTVVVIATVIVKVVVVVIEVVVVVYVVFGVSSSHTFDCHGHSLSVSPAYGLEGLKA